MTILTASAVLALAASCQSTVAPETILQIAQVESGLDTTAERRNTNGSVDKGLMQINSANFDLLGLRDPFDPCQSICAAATLLELFSAYNTGSRTKGIANGYALKVVGIKPVEVTPDPQPPPPVCTAPPWDTWGREACRDGTSPTADGEQETK